MVVGGNVHFMDSAYILGSDSVLLDDYSIECYNFWVFSFDEYSCVGQCKWWVSHMQGLWSLSQPVLGCFFVCFLG